MSNTITEYMLFAMAVVPFLVALGLATAAIVVWLAAWIGTIGALFVVAALFAIVGLFTLGLAKTYEESQPHEHASQSQAQSAASQGSIFDGTAGAMLGLLASNPGYAFSALKFIVRNLPALLAGTALGGLLFSDAFRRSTGTNGADSFENREGDRAFDQPAVTAVAAEDVAMAARRRPVNGAAHSGLEERPSHH
jgi:hypothetical protein